MFSFILLTSLWNEAISCIGRHQLQGASLQKDLVVEDPNTRLMDPETKVTVHKSYIFLVLFICANSLTCRCSFFLQELYFRSQSQEDEILLLRKQVADASLKVGGQKGLNPSTLVSFLYHCAYFITVVNLLW
jgi:hypothetical protein